MSDERPDPDLLLEKVQRQEEKLRCGRLKIFFGACAGVGKTYAMLSAAQAFKRQGADVVVGYVETHGRVETAELLRGLESLPLRMTEYRGRTFAEFDLDAALTRHPSIILVDELAHTNIAGSRHTKRWQDVQELLDAGIDVYSTVNVQHLESLNDIVGQITGIRVWETIPDTVFDAADEVTVVDLPPDELLQRLKEGKVYIPEKAEQAVRSFFRKGNLIALRELALRRTADRVDAQMREYREDEAIRAMWQAKERLLLCVGPSPGGEQLVRSAARLAANLHADWIAVYVETPRLQRLPRATRDRVLSTLRLAQELGAETTTLTGEDIVPALLGYARSRNVSKLVVGKSQPRTLSRWMSVPLAEQLSVASREVDVYMVGYAVEKTEPLARPYDSSTVVLESKRDRRVTGYLIATAACALTTTLAFPLVDSLELTNIVMLYLLSVVVVAFKLGRGPAALCSLLAVLAFDFFFVPPRFTFSVSDTEYLLTFAVMLAVALSISTLAANMRYQTRVATQREQRARALYEMGRELSGALQTEQIVEIANRHLEGVFRARTGLLVADLTDKIVIPTPRHGAPEDEMPLDVTIAQWVFDHQQAAGFGTDTLPGGSIYYLPLKAPMRARGVLAIKPGNVRMIFVPEQHRLLETFAGQIGLALERVHFVEVAQDAIVKIESERLRNSILSAISHDLRTPLTSLVGLSSTLAGDGKLADHTRRELAAALLEEATRMSKLVNNLLEMARLQAGEVHLNRQWHILEEIVGSALRPLRRALANHVVNVQLDPSLPLIHVDSGLMERVLANLIENAAKYTPRGSRISISAAVDGGELRIIVADDGPGLSPDLLETAFDKFTRGRTESSTPGVGLGLAICKAIVRAHTGRIWAENAAGGGARFNITLPLHEPPSVPESLELTGTGTDS